MESLKATIYFTDGVSPLVITASGMDKIGYKFEDEESDYPDCLRVWSGRKTLIVPRERLAGLYLDL